MSESLYSESVQAFPKRSVTNCPMKSLSATSRQLRLITEKKDRHVKRHGGHDLMRGENSTEEPYVPLPILFVEGVKSRYHLEVLDQTPEYSQT